MKLLKHQSFALNYITKKCKDQHGLVLNHQMGSGKTLVGILFLNSFPDTFKKIVILPPKFEALWVAEAIKRNMINQINTFHFISFDEIMNKPVSFYTNSVIVVDEAHNLYKIIDSILSKPAPDERKKIIDFLEIFYSSKKLLLMTGTLIRNNNLSDIRWLINIAAAKEKGIVPYDEKLFINKMTRINKIDIAWINGIRQILEFNPLGIIPEKFKLNFNENIFIDFLYGSLTANIMAYVKTPTVITKKGPLNYKRLKELWASSGLKDFRNIVFATIIMRVSLIALKKFKEFYKENYGYLQLNPEAFKNVKADRYISYYNFNYSKIKNKDYPDFTIVTKKMDYTLPQLILVIKILGIPENLEEKEYLLLEIFDNLKEAEIFRDASLVKSKYVEKGRIIGNLFDEPKKFIEILKIIQQGEQNVIYSNFYESGLLLFGDYLKKKGVKFSIYTGGIEGQKLLDNFKNKKISVLLLHPDFYEGINILGCRNLHILDPIITNIQREQIYARVIRYKSHSHLPKDLRKVAIYNWGCTLKNEIDKIRQSKELITQWFNRSNQYTSIFNLLKYFEDIMSPDDILLSKTATRTNFMNSFNESIVKISIEN